MYKGEQFSQVCYLKPRNLGILCTHSGSQGNPWCLSGGLAWNLLSEMFQGYLIDDWPHLETWVISYRPAFCSWSVCECGWTVTMESDPCLSPVTRLLAAPSFLIPNSVGRSCQRAYTERRGDFEMLLMTQGWNQPLFYSPVLFFLVLSCHLLTWSSSFCSILLHLLIRKHKCEGTGGAELSRTAREAKP